MDGLFSYFLRFPTTISVTIIATDFGGRTEGIDGVILNPPERNTMATAKRITVDGLEAVEVDLDQLLNKEEAGAPAEPDSFDIPEFLK